MTVKLRRSILSLKMFPLRSALRVNDVDDEGNTSQIT